MGRSMRVCAALALAACGSVKANQDPVDAAGGDAKDTTAPVVTITSQPQAEETATSAMFAFTANKQVTFQCAIDTGTAAACTSPFSVSGLPFGRHMFQVQGRDAAGNIGMAMANWAVVAPCTTQLVEGESFASAASGWVIPQGSVLHNGAELEADTAGLGFQFDFTGKGLTVHTEDGPNRGTIRFVIDGGTPVDIQTMASGNFQFQVPHIVATGLLSIPHHVQVQCPTAICSIDYFDYTCN